ncbi:LOB domain-containing protein 23-like [Telopea speciosissima]|uniref:LOB domain-containing protein 23-like n=1 Tax=Telopea speciosissima TaxID=54955 RepID=UPI001CC3D540|nr:LOB domain-containing protein 23-like [Telopea speciosissima]
MASPARTIATPHCAACKYFKKKCSPQCIFQPYFPSNQPKKFEVVRKVFSASSVSKILKDVAVDERAEAANSLYFEALCRLDDQVYGCTGIISQLQWLIQYTEAEFATIKAETEMIKALVISSQTHEALLGPQFQQTETSNYTESSVEQNEYNPSDQDETALGSDFGIQ